jgi:hypothetical protein
LDELAAQGFFAGGLMAMFARRGIVAVRHRVRFFAVIFRISHD